MDSVLLWNEKERGSTIPNQSQYGGCPQTFGHVTYNSELILNDALLMRSPVISCPLRHERMNTWAPPCCLFSFRNESHPRSGSLSFPAKRRTCCISARCYSHTGIAVSFYHFCRTREMPGRCQPPAWWEPQRRGTSLKVKPIETNH